MKFTTIPVRLSYALVPTFPPEGSTATPRFRIRIQYASGRQVYCKERFNDQAAVDFYIGRFYPDLVGKCIGIIVS